MKTLAERCYEEYRARAEEELFERVQIILSSGGSLKGCLHPDFKWFVSDVATDDYDNSVEIIKAINAPPMTREQADDILALGFGQIYETIVNIDGTREGFNWHKEGVCKCCPRAFSLGEEENRRIAQMKAALEWVYNNGEGREVFPNNLDGSVSEEFERIKSLIFPKKRV